MSPSDLFDPPRGGLRVAPEFIEGPITVAVPSRKRAASSSRASRPYLFGAFLAMRLAGGALHGCAARLRACRHAAR